MKWVPRTQPSCWGSLYATPTQSVWKEGKMEGRERGRAQRGWASYSHHQMIVLFLLLKPHPGIPTQFSSCSISLILWDSARNLFFHKIPVTSWNIQLSLSSLNTYLMNMWIVLHRLAQHRADTLFKKNNFSFTSKWMKKYLGSVPTDWEKNSENHPFNMTSSLILNIYSIIQLIFHWMPAMPGLVLSSSDTSQIWVPNFKDCKVRH